MRLLFNINHFIIIFSIYNSRSLLLPNKHHPLPQFNPQFDAWDAGEIARHGISKVPELKIVDQFVLAAVGACEGDGVVGMCVCGDVDGGALDVVPGVDVLLLGKRRDEEAED